MAFGWPTKYLQLDPRKIGLENVEDFEKEWDECLESTVKAYGGFMVRA